MTYKQKYYLEEMLFWTNICFYHNGNILLFVASFIFLIYLYLIDAHIHRLELIKFCSLLFMYLPFLYFLNFDMIICLWAFLHSLWLVNYGLYLFKLYILEYFFLLFVAFLFYILQINVSDALLWLNFLFLPLLSYNLLMAIKKGKINYSFLFLKH